MLKAAAVLEAARNLLTLGVDSRSDLVARWRAAELERAWLSVPGQKSGLSWHYLLILSGVDDVKADRMVCRFVSRVAGRKVSAEEARSAVIGAHANLVPQYPELTLRAVDHAIWAYERGRK